jgi:putative peptidoglycan lipid II flippase
MPDDDRKDIFAGLRITGLATLASRLLGMVRDIATAALFGLASGGVLDAFVVAFRIPSVLRRLFGEGALTASYLPVITARLVEDRRSAWQLLSVMLTWLTVVLSGVVLLGEALCGLVGWFWADAAGIPLVTGLAATLMPYVLFVSLTALLAATLQGLSHFTAPALAPVALNVCWLLGVWVIAPRLAPDKEAQAYALAACVLVAGLVQLAIQWPPLWRAGFRFDYNWEQNRTAVRGIVMGLGPSLFGLAVTQLNTLADVLLAWGLSATPGGRPTVAWLGDAVRYPMSQGAAAAIYYGERLYQFPLGILGVTVATVIFPALSRHATRRDHAALGADLTLGLRLAWFMALPGSLGLVLLAHPIAQLLFQHGEFTADDAVRTARMIACYGAGVWAYCALPLLIRGFYAIGDRSVPVRVGIAVVALNLTLDLLLVWPLGAAGLAIATALSAAIQLVLLAVFFSLRCAALDWPRLGRTALITALATAAMGLVCYGSIRLLGPLDGIAGRLVLVVVPLTASAAAFFAAYWLLGGDELALLTGRHRRGRRR